MKNKLVKTANEIVKETTNDYGKTSSKWVPERKFLTPAGAREILDYLALLIEDGISLPEAEKLLREVAESDGS